MMGGSFNNAETAPASSSSFGSGTTAASFARVALLRYASLALVSPFSVANVLLSVQSLPRPPVDDSADAVFRAEEEAASRGDGLHGGDDDSSADGMDDDEKDDDEAGENPDDDGFHARFERSQFADGARSPASAAADRAKAHVQTDAEGYITVAHVPGYQLPPLRGSHWSAVKALAASSTEGLLSLWKGSCIHYSAPTSVCIIHSFHFTHRTHDQLDIGRQRVVLSAARGGRIERLL